jgi:hypothetical protein
MDILCPKCAEPWDMDELHEEVARRNEAQRYHDEEYEKKFEDVRKDFRRDGCRALQGKCSTNVANPVIGELYDLLGDDIDGAASMLEDFEQFL